ncbi:hypothetical protein ABBQ38_013644 [Trebouxia sp. C0009 RCD-2024]
MYCADATLSSRRSKDADVLLLLQRPQDFITNVPSRLLGHVAFRNKMLGRYSTVVTIPYNPDKSNAQSVADAISASEICRMGRVPDANVLVTCVCRPFCKQDAVC